MISRETFLLINNLFLVITAAMVLIGTLYPLVLDVLELGKISVGPPFFNTAFTLTMLPLVFFVALGMHSAWREQPGKPLLLVLRTPILIAIAAGILIPLFIYGRGGLLVGMGVAAAVMVGLSALIPFIRSFRRAPGTPGISRAVAGMSVAHFGVAMFVFGVTIVSAYNFETDMSMRSGQQVEVAGYDFELRELRDVQGPNYQAVEGTVDIHKDGDWVGQLHPQKRTYIVQKSPMTEAGIHDKLYRDLFVALGDPLGGDAWSVRIQYKPMIRMIWLGALVMALGGLIAITDRRYRRGAKPERSNG